MIQVGFSLCRDAPDILILRLNIFYMSVFCLQARTGRVSRDKIADLLSEPGLNYFQQLGEFFILYLVAKNMDEVDYLFVL